jgi:hypothetical protein
MATTTEEQKQKEAKAAKALADKTSYTALAKWHDGEAARYRKKADECDEIDLVSTAPSGSFGGL